MRSEIRLHLSLQHDTHLRPRLAAARHLLDHHGCGLLISSVLYYITSPPCPFAVGLLCVGFFTVAMVARLLGQLMALALLEGGARRPDVILPVPLHPRRLRERGYNQALELARPISAALGVRTDTVTCMRAAYTSAQVGLDDRERRRNVRGAFKVVRSPVASHMAILDDVVTTGSTVTELARVLRRAGVQRVDVWAVARTP